MNNNETFITIKITRQAHEYLLKLKEAQAAAIGITTFTVSDCASLAILATPIEKPLIESSVTVAGSDPINPA